jgi:hypothetical protein
LARVAVSPEAFRDADGVERSDQGRCPRILGGGADHLLHQFERGESEARIVELLAVLSDAHDDGASFRLGGHGISYRVLSGAANE